MSAAFFLGVARWHGHCCSADVQPTASAEKMIIVSNRLPVTVQEEQGRSAKARLTRSSGGLATALRALHAEPSSRWVGFPGDLSQLTEEARASALIELAEMRAVPVEIPAQEVTRYYDGFANGVLWPLCHYLTERLRLDANQNWEAYKRVNERFANAVVAQYRDGDLIWVHDYQLMLVPGMLRARLPNARIGYFHHIPFPSAEVFRIVPWRQEILEGLLGADVVGFQTAADAYNFTYTAAQLLGLEPTLDSMHYEERTIRVGAYPISIDANEFERIASLPEVAAEASRIRDEAKGRIVVLGVDRLDYTKGILRRLAAVERLLERDANARARLHFIQLAVPTRERDESYAGYRSSVNELVGRVNAHYGSPTSAPIHMLYRSVTPEELVALYRAADVMLVTPIRDGMNLVAKEYVASRIDEEGVLVLSEFAGAATQLREALIVNPYDLDGVAAAIAHGMEMSKSEQRIRMKELRARVKAHDVARWAEGFVADLRRTAIPVSAPIAPPIGGAEFRAAFAPLGEAQSLTLILDYDGTLVPFAATPDVAIPDPALLTLLAQLSARKNTTVHLVTGRSRSSLERWFNELPIGLYAEHGYWSRPTPTSPWTATSQQSLAWKEIVRPILQDVARRTDGSHFEEKTSALAFHYRATEPQLAFARLREIRQRLTELPDRDSFEILSGNKVIEARVKGTNKGIAANAIVASNFDATIFAAGDDRTDEDMFAALTGKALTVHVGKGRTHATYFVNDPRELRRALATLLPDKRAAA